MSERLSLEAFKRAVRAVPAYKKILNEASVAPDKIKNMEQFRRFVPLIDAAAVFSRYDIGELCAGGNLNDVVSVGTSSGSSGKFSYSVLTKNNIAGTFNAHDFALSYFFNIDKRKTLIVNCMSMGQRVFSDLAAIADTCVHEESAIAVIKKFAHKYDQIIMTGHHLFSKKVIEDGREQGIDWKKLSVNTISGYEPLPENWRSYTAHLLGIDPDDPKTGLIASSGGMAELFFHSAFHELAETINIRRLAHKDARLREALFGEGMEYCPLIFVYYPNSLYIESIAKETMISELAFSTLGQDVKMPLIRYRTGDTGKLMAREELKAILDKTGYKDVKLPELKLPIVIFYGRKSRVSVNDKPISPEAVKEALYLDFETAASVTGNFKMKSDGSSLHVDIQLKQGKMQDGRLSDLLKKSMGVYIKVPFDIQLYKYGDFPYSMRLDYERKFAYTD